MDVMAFEAEEMPVYIIPFILQGQMIISYRLGLFGLWRYKVNDTNTVYFSLVALYPEASKPSSEASTPAINQNTAMTFQDPRPKKSTEKRPK